MGAAKNRLVAASARVSLSKHHMGAGRRGRGGEEGEAEFLGCPPPPPFNTRWLVKMDIVQPLLLLSTDHWEIAGTPAGRTGSSVNIVVILHGHTTAIP